METPRKIQVAVYMPDEEAKLFLLFQQYHPIFALMVESGVFQVRNGNVTLHFDSKGQIQAIKRADVLYKSRPEVVDIV